MMQITDALLRHFVIGDEPTSISVSGGRTSGLMFKLTLLANGGRLPPHAFATFANTGKEREETLVFVQRMQDEWKQEIVWVEYGNNENQYKYKIVNFDTASRNGEPFAELLKKRYPHLPHPLMRFCTQELKLRPMQHYLKDKGLHLWHGFVGLRFDEQKRVKRFLFNCGAAKSSQKGFVPLHSAQIVKADVMEFWSKQSFDLGLKDDQGNCDFCMLKGRDKLLRLAYADPDGLDWWIEQERIQGSTFHGPDRMGGKGYTGIKEAVLLEKQGVMLADEYLRRISNTNAIEVLFGNDFTELECGCTD